MAAAGDLTTLAAALAWAGLDEDDDGDTVARLITSTSAAIERWLGFKVKSQSYTRTFNGRGQTALMLPDRPVTAVASVSVDRVSGYFAFDDTFIFLAGGARFPRGVQNVVVTYTAGYAPVPPDIEQACLDWVKTTYQSGVDDDRTPGLISLKAGDTERRFSPDGGALTRVSRNGIVPIPPTVYSALLPYRRVVPC